MFSSVRLYISITLLGSLMHASPSLFFSGKDLPGIRSQSQSSELLPIRKRILAKAKDRCTPGHKDYFDPENPFSISQKGEHVKEGRHMALQVHRVGRSLTVCAEDLGFAYQLTGRRELGEHAVKFIHTIAKQYPCTNEMMAKGFAGGRGDVMRGLALGFDWLSELMTEEQKRDIAEASKGYLELFCKEFDDPSKWWYKVHNYNGVNGGSAGCLALALREVYPEEYEKWLDFSVRIIERWLTTSFDAQGCYSEGVGYAGYGLSNTILLAEALRRSGSAHDLYKHPVFARLGEFYALSLLPGEKVYDARNDSNYAGLNGVPLILSKTLNNGLYRWLWDVSGKDGSFQRILWDNNVEPLAPEKAGVPLAQHFQGRGLCVWRTGWEKDDVMLSFEAGPYYAITHNQADKGHFNLYGLGARWAIDPGYANEREPKGRGQAAAHSCVLIDDKGQARSGAGLGTDGEIKHYSNTGRYGYALADCTSAYQKNNRNMPGVGVEFARRHAFFVYPKGKAPAYAIFLDDIKKDAENHNFTWQMLHGADLQVSLAGNTATLQAVGASGGAYVDTPWAGTEAANASVLPDAENPGELQFDMQVEAAGDYFLWGRIRTQVPERAKADSFFFSLDGGEKIDWHTSAGGGWRWICLTKGVKREAVSLPLTAGNHRLTLHQREPGAEIDCLLLSTEGEVPPILGTARKDPLFREAEAAKMTSPMRLVREAVAPRMMVYIDSPAALVLKEDVRKTMDYHGPGTYPVIRADAKCVNPRFISLLMPLPNTCPAPQVEFRKTTVGREVRVCWEDHEDLLNWLDDGSILPSLK